MAKLVQVIYVEDRRGDGAEGDPVRLVPQLWTLDGKLICESEFTFNQKMDGSGHFEQRCWHEVLREVANG